MTEVPVLTTERLVLRGHRRTDFAPYVAFYASDRAEHIGGPKSEAEVWQIFAAEPGHWALKGFGWWMVEAEGAPIGTVGLHHPPKNPEVEIGWTLFAEAEGRGYAREAAEAALAWGLRHVRPASLVSYIAPANDRSIGLAKRLGAVWDEAAVRPATAPSIHVYRHTVPNTAAA